MLIMNFTKLDGTHYNVKMNTMAQVFWLAGFKQKAIDKVLSDYNLYEYEFEFKGVTNG
tara:strand:+ start:201 stop:374 length:174 start_codon:yes stop_codon:yes gene_type:complete